MTDDATRPPRPRRSRRRTVMLGLAVSLAALVALAGLGEVALRIFHLVRRTPELLVSDERLGWRPAPDVSLERALEDGAGTAYTMTLTQDAAGFRVTRAPRDGARRLLVVGDSFTQAIETDDQAVYHARLARALGLDVVAAGGGGWGSLQECLALEDCLDRVQPHLVLWQFCSNDIINNDVELERGSCCNNNGHRRPYLVGDDAIRYATPKPLEWLWDLKPRSRLARFVLDRWDRAGPRSGTCVEDDIAARGVEHPGFRRGVTTTRLALARARRACRDVPMVAFAVDAREPHLSEFKAICAALDIGFIDGVAEALDEAKRAQRVVVAADGAHWNALGHEVAADVLFAELRAHPALQAR